MSERNESKAVVSSSGSSSLTGSGSVSMITPPSLRGELLDELLGRSLSSIPTLSLLESLSAAATAGS